MMALAVVLAVVAGVAGLYLSYYARTAAGASIAALMVAGYLVAVIATSLIAHRVTGQAVATIEEMTRLRARHGWSTPW